MDKPCYHCGTSCDKDAIPFDAKYFCCNGCKTVYEILNQNELSCYYDFEKTPGTIPKELEGKYDYLDNKDIIEKLIDFSDGNTTIVSFYIPHMHCSSCIWVLENLNKLNPNISQGIVNFPKKTLRVTFDNTKVSIKEIVLILASIGYEPYISLDSLDVGRKKVNRTLIYQLVIAAFAFGNVMLMSFPEYIQEQGFWLNKYKGTFRILMLLYSIPVVFYSAQSYLVSAYKGLRNKILNIDVPISLGILVLFFRSIYDVAVGAGQGYFDSLTGLVFFLLVGKYFQQQTYNYLSFERDYKSYFPIAVTTIIEGEEKVLQVYDIKAGNRLLIRNEELIPVDGILISDEALIDYSFVTGERNPVLKKNGDSLFAGGRQVGGAIEMDATKSVENSYLTQMWSNAVFDKEDNRNFKSLTDTISQYFTVAILLIALLAAVYWYFYDIKMIFPVVSAILIIACPCALALAAPFALGNTIRLFGKNGFYLKNTQVVERLTHLSTIIFDKTGTLTSSENSTVEYRGEQLSDKQKTIIKSVLRASNHPLSRRVYDAFEGVGVVAITAYKEVLGKGIQATVNDKMVKIGSASFVNFKETDELIEKETAIYLSIDAVVLGKYIYKNNYREGIDTVFKELQKNYKLVILSGDNAGEKQYLEQLLPADVQMVFNQKPQDKLDFVAELQAKGENVMMLGDGLNDAGALAQSNVGIAISEDINVFSPACDAIIDAKEFKNLPHFISKSKTTSKIIIASFVISFLYNFVGLFFAISGNLSPIVAAILMPLSSISVVFFVTFMIGYFLKN